MSSMLKKTGGLSFKPKVAPRRPAATPSSSQAPPTSASSSATQTPAAEAPSQASTPTPAAASTPLVESSDREADGIPKDVPKELPKEVSKEPPKETPQVEEDVSSIQTRQVPAISAAPRSTPTSTASSVAADEPPREVRSTPIPASAAGVAESTTAPAPTPISPPTRQPAQPTPAPETSVSRNSPTAHTAKPVSNPSTISTAIEPRTAAAANTLTPGPSGPAQNRITPPTAPPSPTPVSDTIAVSTTVDEPAVTSPKKRAYRKRKSATAEDPSTESPAPRKKLPRRKPTREGDGEAPVEGGEDALPAKRTYKRRRRVETPEELENQTVDHATMKMGELTKDLGIGKRFKHADAIEERARQARERYRLKKLAKRGQSLGLTQDAFENTLAEDEGNTRESAIARARDLGAAAGAGAHTVGYEVIDGQIIINQQSLIVDRHAAHRDMSSLETVEEDEFSHLTTSASFRRESRRTGANHWTEEDTDKFYRLLGMFGTDFETIASMFPGKTRRAIKLKFNREENLRPRRINAAVMVRGEKPVGIDLEEYKAHQAEWQESDKILAEHERLVKEHNEDIRRLKQERRAAGLMDDDDEDEEQLGQEGAQVDGQEGQEGEGEDYEEADVNVQPSTEVAVGA